MHGKLTDPDFNAAVGGDVRQILTIGARMEQLFRDWHQLGGREWPNAFISNKDFGGLWQLHLDLHEDFDDDALKARYAENAGLLEAIAVVLFHNALEQVPGHDIDADTKI